GLLKEPDGSHYFGHTQLKTMSNWVARQRRTAKRQMQEAELDKNFDQIAKWLTGHPRELPKDDDRGTFAEGFKAFEETCIQCHTYKGKGGGDSKGPDFTGYGDADWIRQMILSPSHPLRYGDRNRMPAFRDLEGPTAGAAGQ